MKVTQINKTISLVQADSQETLARTFLRFQEHYESPEWKNKIFTIGQFRAWYSTKYGQNSYETDWSGFNIPSYVLDPFVKGLFDPLTSLEQELLDLFKYRTDKFYIIGAQQDSPSTLEHEVCHGLFYTDDAYRQAVQKLLQTHKKNLKDVYSYVSSMMYHESVLDDEVHAYVSANPQYLQDEGVAFPVELHKRLAALRNKHLKR